MATIAFISEEEFRSNAIGLDLSQYSSATLSGVLTRATAKVENYLGYTLVYEENITEKAQSYVDSDYDLNIFTKKRPIRSLNSVKIVKGDFSTTLTLVSNSVKKYDIVTNSNMIIIPGSSISLTAESLLDFGSLRYAKFFTETNYNAGYYMYDRPSDLIDVVNLYARDEIARSLNTAGARSLSQGSVTISYYDRAGGESDYITDAKAILEDYKNKF